MKKKLIISDFSVLYLLYCSKDNTNVILDKVRDHIAAHDLACDIADAAIKKAQRQAQESVSAGLGKTTEARAVLALQFRALSDASEFNPELWSLALVVADYLQPCAARSKAARDMLKMGFDVDAYSGHPFATHVLLNVRTGRDYFVCLNTQEAV